MTDLCTPNLIAEIAMLRQTVRDMTELLELIEEFIEDHPDAFETALKIKLIPDIRDIIQKAKDAL